MPRIAAFNAVLVLGSVSCAAVAVEHPEIPLCKDCLIRFASFTEGASHLRRQDRFLESLSRFDRQGRLRSDQEVTSADVGEFAANQVLTWRDAEIAVMCEIIESAKAKLEDYRLPFPQMILLVKTTGKEEGNAPYCRANGIILPERVVADHQDKLEWILVHELFHILSSHNPDLRRELYAIVGFEPCAEIELPESLVDRKITNPDAPRLDTYIELMIDGHRQAAVPLQYAEVEEFDPRKGVNFLAYRIPCLLAIERDGDGWQTAEQDGKPILLDPVTTSSYLQQIGRNTAYIIHPEETLAENFAHLVFRTKNLPTPRVVNEIDAILKRLSPDRRPSRLSD